MGKTHPAQMREGEAVFFPPKPDMWAVRQTARQAALNQTKTRRFVVTREEMYYPAMLDQLLSVPGALGEAAFALGKDVAGRTAGRIRCVLLWESGWEGVLLHREGAALLCAYAPVMTERQARRERELALLLAALANRAADIPILLQKGWTPGRQNLGKILRSLSQPYDLGGGKDGA